MTGREMDLLLEMVDRYGSSAHGEPEALALAAKRLRALLTGLGNSDDYIDEAARLLVERHLGGGVG